MHIVGSKWCGKTTTAKQLARSYIEMQDPDKRDMYIETAKIKPSNLLVGENPQLIIESLVKEYNKTETQGKLRLPDLKIVITGTQYGYLRPDGVYVIPIGCLCS